MSYWSNDEDIQNDMLALSEFYNPSAPEPAPEPSDIKKRLCGKPSIFESDYQDDEPVQEQYTPVPIRGHPVLRNGIRKPGGYPTTTNQHLQTSANIREVSGFGYSNDLIEHAFKASNSEDEKEPQKMKNLKFESPSHSGKVNNKKNEDDSDSNISTSSEYISYSSRSDSSGNINVIDIHSKTEFPDLK